MSFDAGQVIASVGGKLDLSAFEGFDAAMKKATASAEAFEARMATVNDRIGKTSEQATTRVSSSVGKQVKQMSLLDEANNRAAGTMETLGRAAKVTAVVGLLAVGAAAVESAKSAITFQAAMEKVHTQAGATQSEVTKLSKAVLGLAGKVPQGPKELADGLYHLESAGFRGAQALSLLKAAAQGAAIGQANLEDTTQALIAMTASHIKGVKGAADAMGQMNAVVGVGDMKMESFAKAMATGILPAAHNAGLSFKDVGAALATITDNATPANETATRLRMTIALLAAPSGAATKQLASIGLQSTTLATDMRKPNGLLLAFEDLKTHLRDSGKTAEQQDAILTKIFGGGKSSAAAQTLISQLDRLKSKYDELGKTNGPQLLADAWEKYQKTTAASLGEAKSSAEAAEIAIGNALLPTLASAALAASHFVQSFTQGGAAGRFGHDLASGFSEAGQVIGSLVPIAKGAAEALIGVAHALDLGNATHIEAILAGFAGFKIAGVIAPLVLRFGEALKFAMLAASTGNLGVWVATLGSSLSPLTLAAGAAAALAAGLVLLGGHEDQESRLAHENADAHKAEAAAIKAHQQAVLEAANKGLAAHDANKQEHDDQAAVNKLRKEGKTDTKAYRDAMDQLRGSHLQATAAQQTYVDSIKAQHVVDADRIKDAKKRLDLAAQEAQTAQRRVRNETQPNPFLNRNDPNFGKPQAATPKTLNDAADAQKALTQRTQEWVRAVAVAQTSDLSRQRLMNVSNQITAKNALGIRDLAVAMDGIPKSKQTQILLQGDQDALSRVGRLISSVRSAPKQAYIKAILAGDEPVKVKLRAITALVDGVPKSTVASILATTNGQGSVDALTAAIARVQSKQVTVAVDTISTQINRIVNFGKRASGRGPGHGEMALVGEGRAPEDVYDPRTGQHAVVDRPTLMHLPASAYVIPRDRRYAGRAAGLLASLARDMGFPGYASGRSGVNKGAVSKQVKKMPIPPRVQYAAVDETQFATTVTHERDAWKKREASIASEQKKLKAAEKKMAGAKAGKARNAAKADRDRIAKDLGFLQHGGGPDNLHSASAVYRAWQEDSRNLKALHAENTKIARLNSVQENDRQKMDNAAKAGNSKAYDAAQTDRTSVLGQLRAIYKTALGLAPKGSTIEATIDGLLQGVIGDQQDNASTFEGAAGIESEGDRFADTGLTDAEVLTQKQLEKKVALAGLTADNADDIAATTALQQFLEGVLNLDVGGRTVDSEGASDDAIATLAGAVAQARQDVASATQSTPDQQAQIDQANARADAATANAAAAGQVLQAFTSSGDIGTGNFRSAFDAARGGPQIVFQSYVPPTPAQAHELGQHVVTGLGYQNPIATPRIATGI